MKFGVRYGVCDTVVDTAVDNLEKVSRQDAKKCDYRPPKGQKISTQTTLIELMNTDKYKPHEVTGVSDDNHEVVKHYTLSG